MALQVYNTLTRRKEEFVPLTPGRVMMYVCGPTVYDHAHIGHAKTYISFDVIVRYLRHSGYEVRYVQNITDVGHLLDSGEDRILKGAARERIEPMEVVERYARSYFEDMDALGVQRPDISPRASAHVPEQIEMIKKLIADGHAYEVNGAVYFDVSSFPEYGKLSGRRVEEMEEGARVAVREEKRHPEDFALWKQAEPEHILKWLSPWGWGYPGWHIECSAMSAKYLGPTFDIHGGGVDNIFPHNECEIAQSEAAHGQPFAHYWLLGGSLTVSGVKMSKSLGNFLTIKDALKKYRAEALRFFILSSHYRSPIDFSDEALAGASRGWERVASPASAVRERLKSASLPADSDQEFLATLADFENQFGAAMDDDFNAPAAVAVLFELAKVVNTLLNSDQPLGRGTLEAIDALYRELGGQVLGIIPEQAAAGASAEREAGLIRLLIDMRAEARKRKDFATSDSIRDRLAALGVVLEDGREGTTWKISG
ncbi:MAG: cysteine--tRNA ligase [Chloroflexi bacterium]|nr:cysteine--tRNA ligase [Chloroflexota bacterium]